MNKLPCPPIIFARAEADETTNQLADEICRSTHALPAYRAGNGG